jgi:hypothetical protein
MVNSPPLLDIDEAAGHRDISDFIRPNLVWTIHCEPAQQIWIHHVARRRRHEVECCLEQKATNAAEQRCHPWVSRLFKTRTYGQLTFADNQIGLRCG